MKPGAHPTNDISIKFEILPKLGVLKCKIHVYLTHHNEILHMSWQCNCRDRCRILLWLVEYISN